jgi:hypothetical protein
MKMVKTVIREGREETRRKAKTGVTEKRRMTRLWFSSCPSRPSRIKKGVE